MNDFTVLVQHARDVKAASFVGVDRVRVRLDIVDRKGLALCFHGRP